MALWPFRKRRKRAVAEGKKTATPAVTDGGVERKASLSRSQSKRRTAVFRRNASRRGNAQDRETSYASSTGPVPDFPLPPTQPDEPAATGGASGTAQQGGGFSSQFQEHFQEHNQSSMTHSTASSNLPHKKPSILRKLSQRRTDQSYPPVAYEAHVSRQNSKAKRVKKSSGDRPLSMHSTTRGGSMLSNFSETSSRAYKIRSLDVYMPRPTLHYDEASSPTSMHSHQHVPGLTPSRTNSKRSTRSRVTATPEWRYKGLAISEEQFLSNNRVDGLADDLDAKAIREVLERDLRRKARRKQDDEERARRRLERREREQRAREDAAPTSYEEDHPMQDVETGESSRAIAEENAGYVMDPRARPTSTMGTQTPLSWLDINPSSEEVNKVQPFPRPDVVTPVSMNSQELPVENSQPEPYAPESNGDVGIAIFSPPEQATEAPAKGKASAWNSFLKRATTTRAKKEQDKGHLSRAIQVGDSTLVPDTEEVDVAENNMALETAEMEMYRHREGQTPRRHIPREITFAMNALETGHLQQDLEYEDEMRDSLPDQPLIAAFQGDSPSSSTSSLGKHNNLSPRPASSPKRAHTMGMDDSSLRTVSQQSRDGPRPLSTQRYTPSPSMHRYSSGGASPDNGPRSVMSTSLASIDSEGSWLSGRMSNPRRSIQHVSPLQRSASSLRKRYHDTASMQSTEEYFGGVDRTPQPKSSSDAEVGGARLELSDGSETDEDDDEEGEGQGGQNIWKEGLEKRVVVHERPMHARASSRQGMLDDFGEDFDDGRRASNASNATAKANLSADGPASSSPAAEDEERTAAETATTEDTSVFETPLETPVRHPFNRTDTADTAASGFPLEFQTPLEQPADRGGLYE